MCGLSADSSGGRTGRQRDLAPEGRIAPLGRADGRGRRRGLGFGNSLCATRQTNAGNMRRRHSARVHRRDGGVRHIMRSMGRALKSGLGSCTGSNETNRPAKRQTGGRACRFDNSATAALASSLDVSAACSYVRAVRAKAVVPSHLARVGYTGRSARMCWRKHSCISLANRKRP
jgi:hypothetical protein